MKRLGKGLTGKKIKFLKDTEYSTINDLNSNINNSYASGVTFDGKLNDDMNVKEFENFEKYLRENGFIKGDSLVIPEGTIATVEYDNAGNDLELKINERLNIIIINNFVFDNSDLAEDSIPAELID